MDENNKTLPANPDELEFFKSISDLIQTARRSVEKNINTTMVVNCYEIGRRIIYYIRNGDRA